MKSEDTFACVDDVDVATDLSQVIQEENDGMALSDMCMSLIMQHGRQNIEARSG